MLRYRTVFNIGLSLFKSMYRYIVHVYNDTILWILDLILSEVVRMDS